MKLNCLYSFLNFQGLFSFRVTTLENFRSSVVQTLKEMYSFLRLLILQQCKINYIALYPNIKQLSTFLTYKFTKICHYNIVNHCKNLSASIYLIINTFTFHQLLHLLNSQTSHAIQCIWYSFAGCDSIFSLLHSL